MMFHMHSLLGNTQCGVEVRCLKPTGSGEIPGKGRRWRWWKQIEKTSTCWSPPLSCFLCEMVEAFYCNIVEINIRWATVCCNLWEEISRGLISWVWRRGGGDSRGNLIRRSEECLLRSADMHTAALLPTDTTIFRSKKCNLLKCCMLALYGFFSNLNLSLI